MGAEKYIAYGDVNGTAFARVILLFLFVLNPFLSFCLAIVLFAKLKERTVSLFVIISFFGLLGYTYLPFFTMDITRHYIIFERLKLVDSFSDFILHESYSEKPDFFLDFLYWILGKNIDTHQIVGFLGASFYYGFMLGIIYNWQLSLKQQNVSKIFYYLFFMFLALVPVTEFSGMRQGNAIMLFLFIISIPEAKIKKSIRVFLLVIPCLLHFSLYPIVLLYLCACFLSKKSVFILSLCLIAGFYFFVPLMEMLMKICLSLGGVGIGIASKIEGYIFADEIEAALYSGSVIRFVVIIVLLFFYPFIAYVINKKIDTEQNLNLKFFHYFFMLFFSYIVFSSSSYVLSRNLILFKLMIAMYILYGVFSCQLKWRMKRFLLCLFCFVIISGPFSFYFGKEYRTLNFSLFTSNLFEIIHLKTKPEGYNVV